MCPTRLADAAEFLLTLKDQYKAPNSPIITFGCSYPGKAPLAFTVKCVVVWECSSHSNTACFVCDRAGALAAWFRLKYPHVTYASVASSAPVEATLDFFQYLDVVDKSLGEFPCPTLGDVFDAHDGELTHFSFCHRVLCG
jgi:hypothetical protein